ncbi:hypothetical protein OIU79_021041 [Salix purpurea]|uniref:Uncharacterized protein n=1 Tax=Salix purpurea TaxID=77065 RepID=A0A9Q1AG90_SALPP|nr:hypothetical protein OIU79_021041 [Salix purpurea]
MKHQVAIRQQFQANDSFIGRVGLPSNPAISIRQHKISVRPKGESGIFTNWVSSVGLPNPTHG